MAKSQSTDTANDCGQIWVMDLNSSNASEIIVVLISINGVSLSLAIFLNVSAMIVLKRIQDIPGGNKVTLFNLSLADFLSGILSQVLWIVFMTGQLLGHQICPLANATTFCGLMLYIVSFSTLVLASIERYICIFYPFLHARITDTRIFLYIIICIWFTGLLNSILYIFPVMKTAVTGCFALINSIGCFIMAYIYARVCHLAYKVRKEIKDQAASVGNQQTERQDRKERRSVRMIAVVVSVSLLVYFPYGICLYIGTFTDTIIEAKVFDIIWTLALTNSFLDPICYFMFNKTLRKKMIALWRSACSRNCIAS